MFVAEYGRHISEKQSKAALLSKHYDIGRVAESLVPAVIPLRTDQALELTHILIGSVLYFLDMNDVRAGLLMYGYSVALGYITDDLVSGNRMAAVRDTNQRMSKTVDDNSFITPALLLSRLLIGRRRSLNDVALTEIFRDQIRHVVDDLTVGRGAVTHRETLFLAQCLDIFVTKLSEDLANLYRSVADGREQIIYGIT